MNIVSPIWIAWIAGFTAVYWMVPRAWRDIYSIMATAAFLLVNSPLSLFLLAALCVATFYIARPEAISGSTVAGTVSGIVVLYVLFQKDLVTVPHVLYPDLGLPLGMAYYIFRCMHYVIEAYKDKLEAHSFRQYCAYLFFLPTIVYGPVHRFPAFLRDARRYRWDPRLFGDGLERILYGYVKVTFLSHFLLTRIFLEMLAELEATHSYVALYLTVWCKGLSFFFLLAGYADVAIGFALLLGYRVMEDYKWPFFSRNLSEFWGTWHISVSGWCREYVRGAVTAFTRRPKLGVVATMLVFSLWHGISTHHLFWGIYNGLGLAAWHKYRETLGRKISTPSSKSGAKSVRIIGRVISTLFTAHFLLIGFVFLNKDGREELGLMIMRLFA